MSNGGLDVGEHASSAPLMRVLYWKLLAASAATGNYLSSAICVFYQKTLTHWAFYRLSDTNRYKKRNIFSQKVVNR
ncbi:hypothetical protein [Nostoc sp.]|uniref:hypothetical protein n=1 Tax=Nostoc sp. TaxID=1180 RepID=UPI002FF715F4